MLINYNKIFKSLEQNLFNDKKDIIIPYMDNIDYLLDIINTDKTFYLIIPNLLNININYSNVSIIRLPSNDLEDLELMAQDLKEEIKDSIIFNPYKSKELESYVFKTYSKEIGEEFNELSIPLNFGFEMGLAKYFKLKYDTKIIVRYNKTIEFDKDLVDLEIFDNNLTNELITK